MSKGLAVIIRNEEEFNRLKEFLGEEILYLDFVPQMAEVETSVIIHYIDNNIFSIGSVGSTKYQEEYEIRHIEFSEFFK